MRQLFLYCLLIILIQPLSAQQKRLALLIGNSQYQEAPLKNPVNDATRLGQVLQSLDFSATVRTNRALPDFEADINRFCNQIRRTKQQGFQPIVCFYYSGHGMQIKGINYLMPVNHRIADQGDVRYKAYPMDRLLEKLNQAGGDVNIIIMDACRNNPFERSLKGRTRDLFPELSNGLADVGTPTAGTLIAYATSPGKTADDGSNSNSPYARALIKHLPSPDLSIEQAFRAVRNDVYQETRETQIPWESSSLMGDDLILKPGALPPPPVTTVPAIIRTDHCDLVRIEGGSFQMGDQFEEGGKNELPVHTVQLSPFYLSTTEVSNEDFAQFLSAEGNQTTGANLWVDIESSYSKIKGNGTSFQVESNFKNHPVAEVNWYGAILYCNWRSRKEGLEPAYRISGTTVSCNWDATGYRLPTEAEWEFAARERGKKVRFGNGKNIADPKEINFKASESSKTSYSITGVYRGTTTSIGTFAPNHLGLHDMSGNVWEWCWDWYGSDYYQKSQNSHNPHGPDSGSSRVVRGAAWHNSPIVVRAAMRLDYSPGSRSVNFGFRLARSTR